MYLTYKNTLLSFYFLLIFTLAQSQTAGIDSLKNELLLHTEEDTIRVNILNELIFDLYEVDMKTTEELIKESEYLVAKLDFTSGKAQLLYYKGYIYMMKSDYPKVIESNNQAIKLYESLANKQGISFSLNSIGIAYYYLGDFPKAIVHFEKAAAINKARNDLAGVSASLDNIGNIYADQGKYEEAQTNYLKSKAIKESLNDSAGLATIYNNLGSIYAEQGDYPRALESFNKCLNIRNKLNNESQKLTVINNLAAIYKYQKKYEKSLAYYNQGLKICRKLDNKREIAKYLNGIGNVYQEQFKYKEALAIFMEALDINQRINVQREIAESLTNIANVQLLLKNDIIALDYYNQALKISKEIDSPTDKCWSYLGIARVYVYKKQYAEALDFALKAEEIAVNLEFIETQRDAKALLAIIYENLGNFKEAFASHQQFKILNDSLFNEENIEKITQLEYEYKYKQEIEEAKTREFILTKTVTDTSQDLEKSQRNSFIAIIIILLISLISVGAIFFLKLQQVQAENKNIRIQQKLLRSQMTPHFMFNSLSILQGLILNKEEEKSISYLSQFSKLLRITLENSRHQTVSLTSELAAIDSYMSLQNLDAGLPYNYVLSVDPTINDNNISVPPMLIQPFVENAIEHAFINHKGPKEIIIKLTLKEAQLICTIADNGIGIIEENKKSNGLKNSLATTITSERLAMLSKDFKMPGSIKVENKDFFGEQGTLVTLVIPYKINLEE